MQEIIMTPYEKWALIISIIAILIPIIQWILKRWIVKARLNHYQTGNGYLFINQSGSYIRIQSVFEAVNKPISIKSLALQVKRERDNQCRNYVWSAFTSPTNMQFVGNNASMYEIAHPFRIEADHVFCAFTEYSDKNQSAYRMLLPYYSALSEKAKEYRILSIPFDEAKKAYQETKEYKDAKQKLEGELFWLIDKYEAIITAKYGKQERKFALCFEVTNEQNILLQQNMKESLIIPLKVCYDIPPTMQPVTVQVYEKQ